MGSQDRDRWFWRKREITGFAKPKLSWSLIWQGALRTSNEKYQPQKGDYWKCQPTSEWHRGFDDRKHGACWGVQYLLHPVFFADHQESGAWDLCGVQKTDPSSREEDWGAQTGIPWELVGYIHECSGSWPMSLWKPLFIILEGMWYWGERNVIPAFRKGKEENTGNYCLVIFDLILVRVRDQTTEEITSRHMKEKKVIGNSQCELGKENHASPIW